MRLCNRWYVFVDVKLYLIVFELACLVRETGHRILLSDLLAYLLPVLAVAFRRSEPFEVG